jgi:hypothetical protein
LGGFRKYLYQGGRRIPADISQGDQRKDLIFVRVAGIPEL